MVYLKKPYHVTGKAVSYIWNSHPGCFVASFQTCGIEDSGNDCRQCTKQLDKWYTFASSYVSLRKLWSHVAMHSLSGCRMVFYKQL